MKSFRSWATFEMGDNRRIEIVLQFLTVSSVI